MPFNALLIDSLHYGDTLKENSSSVTIKHGEFDKNEETVLIFKSDEKYSFFREKWIKKAKTDNSEKEPKCCDGIIFYHKKETPEKRKEKQSKNEPLATICFVELKSNSEFPEAVEQIQNTYEIVREKLKADFISREKINWKAVIVSTTSLSQKEKQNAMRDLMREFGPKNVKELSAKSETDITKFIRGE